jgi:hypothetical protein
MKKGKTSKINLFNDAKTYYGTVDSKNFKSVYLVIQTWVEPIKEFNNWDRANGILTRQIKHTLMTAINNDFFESHCIVDMDLRSSGIKIGKKSFMNLEITLFVKGDHEFKSLPLRNHIKEIMKSVYLDNVKSIGYFNTSKNKTKKQPKYI